MHADKKSANNKNPYTRFPLIVVSSISRRIAAPLDQCFELRSEFDRRAYG